MIIKKNGAGWRTFFLWLATALAIFSVLFILTITYYVFDRLPLSPAAQNSQLDRIENQVLYGEQAGDSHGSELLFVLTDLTKGNNFIRETMREIIVILIGIVLFVLLLLGLQMYMWGRDREVLEQWREAGFLCERMEFLPANRIKLNNIELELNKTQIENLKKLAMTRCEGKPLHSLDLGDHGVQSIKRLREELGARFIEKSLIKVWKHEGYWLDVEASRIHGASS